MRLEIIALGCYHFDMNITEQNFKLAAIDLDGTLLGPDGHISPANLCAVQRLQRAGVQVVLASGRQFESMRPYADALPGVEWLVSCQGGELSNVSRNTVITTGFLSADLVQETLEMGKAQGLTTLAYAVDGIYTDADWNADLQFYTDLASCRPVHCPVHELFGRQIFKVIWMSTPREIERAVQQHPVNPASIQMVRTHARFLEFMPVNVTKAAALGLLAERLGMTASETVVFGDGDNDVPMFEWAGVSVAMAHGWPAALQAATYTTPAGPAGTALARGVDWLFDNHILRTGNPTSGCFATTMAA